MPKWSIENFGRNPNDPDLKVVDHWQKTGNVHDEEHGPGCGVACIYCNQMVMDITEEGDRNVGYIAMPVDGGISLNTRMLIGSKLDSQVTIPNLLEDLKRYSFYTPESFLLLENFNDPGINWFATAALAKALVAELGHTGPITFITKFGITDAQTDALVHAQEAGAKLTGIVTYSGLPQVIEPNSPTEMRLDTMKKLKEKGIPVVCSIRPIIEGINSLDETIDQVLLDIRNLVDVVIAGGLFVYDIFTIDTFLKAGYPLRPEYAEQIYSIAKKMLRDYKQLVRDRVRYLGLDIQVQNHTSCVISQIMTQKYNMPTPDRFPHWVSPKGLQFDDDCFACPSDQKTVCYATSLQESENVIYLAKEALT